MIKVCCDFCKKEMRYSQVTVSVDNVMTRLGESGESEYHFHTECATRLRNKFNDFTIERMKKDTRNLENKVSELKEKMNKAKSIVDLDDKTLFQCHQEASALAKELSTELLRREP